MGQQGLDVNLACGEEYTGDQTIAVVQQVEHQDFADLVRAWKGLPDIGKAGPICRRGQTIPVQCFGFRRGTIGETTATSSALATHPPSATAGSASGSTDESYFSRPSLGSFRVPVILIFVYKPAPFLAKNGSTGFKANRFQPVCVCESFACSRKSPWKSITSLSKL